MPTSAALREGGCVFCRLEGRGRVLLENAFEALHLRCLPGDARPQLDDPVAECGW